jgi:hypothetical protein
MSSVTPNESIPAQWCRYESALSRMKPLGCFDHGCKLRSTAQGGVKVFTGLAKITGWRDLGGKDEPSESGCHGNQLPYLVRGPYQNLLRPT